MWLDGEPYAPRNPLDARRAGVAMIYQELSLAPHLSVMENILLGMEPTRGPFVNWRRGPPARGRRAGGSSGRPDIPPDTPVGRLSVAEQQLVEIGRAVAVGCRVLVLDEPTSSLTARDIAQLFDLVRRLKAQGHAIIYISHFLEEVQEITDRFTVLRDGRSVGGGRTARRPVGRIIAMMVGRDGGRSLPALRRTPGEVVLEVTRPGRRDQAASASLTLRRGEVLGIAGLVGAGRTELLRAIFGLDARAVRARSASATYLGPASPARRWAQGVGMVSEDRKAEGLALGAEHRRQPDAVEAAGLGPAARAAAGRTRRRGAGSTGWRSAAAGRASRSATCPAATSRRSRSPGCCTTTWTCCCWTSRRAASTSAPRRRSTADRRAGLATRRRPPRGADGQQLPAGIARRLRPHRRHVPRRARPGPAGRRDRTSTRSCSKPPAPNPPAVEGAAGPSVPFSCSRLRVRMIHRGGAEDAEKREEEDCPRMNTNRTRMNGRENRQPLSFSLPHLLFVSHSCQFVGRSFPSPPRAPRAPRLRSES